MSDKTQRTPVTPAIRFLRNHDVTYSEHLYEYQEKGGTASVSEALSVDEHLVVKTLIMETDKKQPIVVLMHGDKSVSTKELARILGTKRVAPCEPKSAQKHSGYMVGGTSPFGTRTAMPVYVEASILELDRIYINGGHRGFILDMSPQVLVEVLHAVKIQVAV